MSTLSLGVDLGGSTARAAVIERETGRVVRSAKQPWADRSPEAVVQATAQLLGTLSQEQGLRDATIGVGFAGMIKGSVVLNAPNLGWRDVDFGQALTGALHRPVTLVNDLSAAAWGEFAVGAAKGARDTFTVFVGTGVGSAIITEGRLLAGASQVAAEFGHVKVVIDGGRRCGCGQDGCLEAYLGGAKLAEWMREEGLTGGAVELEPMANRGEKKAKTLYDFAVGHLALAIANQITVLNPAVLVLGGGVLSRCPGMVARIRQVISARATVASRTALRVEMATLGDDAGLVGAALLA